MYLGTLYDHVTAHFPAYARKDLKTAVHVLAKALDYPTPISCPPEAYTRPLPEIYRLVERYLYAHGKSMHSVRNTKNNLSRMLRFAESQGLYIPTQAIPKRRFPDRAKPNRPGSDCVIPDRTHLRFQHWPQSLQNEFKAFRRWATAPIVEGRSAKLRKRAVTLHTYQRYFEGFLGYLSHTRNSLPRSFDELFDYNLIRDYVYWHVNVKFKRPTVTAHEFLKTIRAITHQYRLDADLNAQLHTLQRSLPRPTPIFDKTDAWVSLAELERIGIALWPEKLPHQLQSTGTLLAMRAGVSLMLRLWCFIPYRQRNMREMQLQENLYRNPQGLWHIKFSGEQLKIASKKGKRNTLNLPFPEVLVPTLEAYLSIWRPLLVAQTHHKFSHVFLNSQGKPYTMYSLNESSKRIVYGFTGKHWHPHIVRTVWATEWIRNTHGDFYTAAIMLNDRLETVIASYAHLLEEDVAEKAYHLIQERNGRIKGPTHC